MSHHEPRDGPGDGPGTQLAAVFRAEHARVVASLARRFGDLDLAEDATGEALVVAAERWPVEGVPPNPGGWPKGGQTRLNLPNNHLQYAFTWFGIALTLIGVYGAFAWRRLRETDSLKLEQDEKAKA